MDVKTSFNKGRVAFSVGIGCATWAGNRHSSPNHSKNLQNIFEKILSTGTKFTR
ncbi:hypothetical protein AtDm6_2190 [Acetobacter tropicalis]|uniref:Uncharacterized protein n=1 Tax=Acetobacter tropicalis TaxID=104102 RepID=A0A094YPS3_9PROT|nr:hypothetical protein AtDm6_2190 [Acetobacter tropicalis]